MKMIAKNVLFTLAIGIFCAQNALAGIAVQHWSRADGARVYLVESPAIPMVDVQLDFDAGGRREPAAQAGLASVTAAMLSKGVRAAANAPALDENALAEAWMDLGAQFGADAGSDRFSVSLRSLTAADLLARAAQLAARQLADPAFPEAVWQRERERLGGQLREARTRPSTVAGEAFAAAVYGSHPYGRDTTVQTLARIEVDDLRAWHARLLPCRAAVSLVGAVNRAQAEALVDTLLARLPRGTCPAQAAVPDVAPLAAARERLIPFESAQAHVLIGQPGIRRADPDFLTLLVANHVLGGGGFVSRLTQAVREQRGLSYSVYSGFSPGLHAGAFTVGLQTRPDQAAEAVRVVREVLRDFVARGPTPQELRAAKDNLIGGFPLRLDSNRKLLDNLSNIAWNGLPLDYLDRWTDRVEAVSLDDIRAALQRVLQPDRMVTVVVGGR